MDAIVKKLFENRQIVESEDLDTAPEVEEEETLEEDWRAGTFDDKDMDAYEKKFMEDIQRLKFSLDSLEKMHPEFRNRFKTLRDLVKKKF